MPITLPLHNIKVESINNIFIKNIEPNLINELYEFKLIKDDKINLKNKDVTRLIYHYTVLGLCEHIINKKHKQKIIFHHNIHENIGKELIKYTDKNDFKIFINKFLVKFSKALPLRFYFTEMSYKLVYDIIIKCNGSTADVISELRSIDNSIDISKYSFNKIRYFAKKYKLTYLSTNFFEKVKHKQLIIG